MPNIEFRREPDEEIEELWVKPLKVSQRDIAKERARHAIDRETFKKERDKRINEDDEEAVKFRDLAIGRIARNDNRIQQLDKHKTNL